MSLSESLIDLTVFDGVCLWIMQFAIDCSSEPDWKRKQPYRIKCKRLKFRPEEKGSLTMVDDQL